MSRSTKPDRAVLITLSLLGPPWVVLVSSPLNLYLVNQEELGFQVILLAPYVLSALAVWIGVSALYFAFFHRRKGRVLLWLYYLSSFVYLAFPILRTSYAEWERTIIIGLGAAALATAILLDRRAQLSSVIGVLALGTGTFVAADLVSLASELDTGPNLDRSTSQTASAGSSAARLPNIYHVVFDEYQTDLFQLTLDESTRDALAGFTFFPENSTPFGRTGMALPAILTGQLFDFQSPQIKYQQDAFSAPSSILHHLREMGYTTEAFIHRVYTFPLELFHRVTYHEPTLPFDDRGLRATFFDLWMYTYFPRPIGRRVIEESRFRQFQNQNVLNPQAPVVSYQVMRSILAREEHRASNGRYTFIHLILPHFPNVLTSDCGHNQDGSPTSAVEQAMCANHLVKALIGRLKSLKRLDQSILILQGDHGSVYAVEDGRAKDISELGFYSTQWSRARSRPLLLIKPPMADPQPLRFSNKESSIIDVAPTLMAMLGSPISTAHGTDLFGPAPLQGRSRFYHFYSKKGPNEWTDAMVRFRIEGDALVEVGRIELENNPKPE